MNESGNLRRSLALLFSLPSLAFCASAGAATFTWPNTLPFGTCRATLQDCIDGAAAGDIVQIGVDELLFPDRYTTVDEDITISRSLTLRAAPGIDAVFAAGRRITAGPLASAPAQDIALEGLVFERGSVRLVDPGNAAHLFRAERLRFNDVRPGECAIRGEAPLTTAVRFHFFRNFVRVRPPGDAETNGLCLVVGGANWEASVYGNWIEAPRARLRSGIVVSTSAAGPVTLSNNTVIGRELQSGFDIQQFPGGGRGQFQVVNNSISGQESDPRVFGAGIQMLLYDADAQVVNNTVVDGRHGLLIGSFAPTPPPVTGLVANNLVAFNRVQGLVIVDMPAVANRNNLVFGNGVDTFVPGPGTRTTDPQLQSLAYPRPLDSSPAVNAGSNSALPAFTVFDVDGQPRVMLATVDIGAHEAGYGLTGVHVATDENVTLNQTDVFDIGGTALSPGALMVASPLRMPGADDMGLAQNLGVWLPGGTGTVPLSLFHEDAAVSLLPGRRFTTALPGFGLTGFMHLTTPGNVSAQYTTLSNAALDGRPDAIAVALHNYLASGPYHDRAIGLEYFGTNWLLRNEDAAFDMPANRNFNVVVAPRFSENAWRAVAPSSGPVAEIPLPHPLLDDNGCAAPLVGRVDAPGAPLVSNPVPFSVSYRTGVAGAAGRWFVAAESGTSPSTATFPAGAAFNVIVDGAQANACRASQAAPLFTNGFE